MGGTGKKRAGRAKKKDDDFRPGQDNSRDESQSEDPEIQQLMDKIEKLNEAEENAGKSLKRTRKSVEPTTPEPAKVVSSAKTTGRKKKAAPKEPSEAAGPIPWEPAETALLTMLIAGQVPVVKLPTDSRVTNQYKGMLF